MRTIIAGSRDITDWTLLIRAIRDAQASFADGWPITRVLCGGARGVDTLGKLWAEALREAARRYERGEDLPAKAEGE